MKNKSAMVAVALQPIGALVATMVAASASAQPGPSCTGTNHCVNVTVAAGAIQSVPATVVTASNHQIYWILRTGGYKFPVASSPSAGVAFKPASSINDNGHMPPNEFHCNRVSDTVFHCTDANSTHDKGVRSYQYSINVLDAAGHPVASEPWIVNR